jgi:hypothetical protein
MRNMCLLGLLAMTSAGCYSTWDIAPKSLESLNGYHEPEARPLADMTGEQVEFDHSTELRFTDTSGVPKAEKFSSIQVNGPTFAGTVRPDNHPFLIDLKQVSAVEAKKFSALKTGLVIGIPVGIVVIASVIAIVVATSAGDDGDDSSGLTAGPSHRK